MSTLLRHRGLLLPVAAIAAVTWACSLGRQTTAGSPAPGSPSPGAVSSLEQAKAATVRIVAEGTFIDPEVGMMVNAAGSGSGFIIDPSGIAVTNNHVVTGAALLRVYVGGEAEPRNARVLGASECSDLAVIDIDGEGFPYFEWSQEPVKVGTDVYAAGYPLGDPEFTLTRGIISKERHSGETPWSSVGSVIEHDATINPGSSGGPLITPDGKVVAVNYMKSVGDAVTASQSFAIAREEALPLIEKLRGGENPTSIGINGEAVNNGEGLSGIWISSVRSGSAADVAGVKGGDIILSMEGLVLGTDYTLSSYCDILRTHQPTDTLSIAVLRFATSEFLEGQLNGRKLEVSFSFDNALGSQLGKSSGGGSTRYSSYATVTDDTRALQVDIPGEWADVDGSPWIDNGDTIGAALSAAPELDQFWDSWIGSGMYFYVSDAFDRLGGYVQLLDHYRTGYEEDCVDGGRYEFQDLSYKGEYDVFTQCGGENGPMLLILAAVPKDDPQAFLVFIGVQVTKEADLDAVDHVLRTFKVVCPLP